MLVVIFDWLGMIGDFMLEQVLDFVVDMVNCGLCVCIVSVGFFGILFEVELIELFDVVLVELDCMVQFNLIIFLVFGDIFDFIGMVQGFFVCVGNLLIEEVLKFVIDMMNLVMVFVSSEDICVIFGVLCGMLDNVQSVVGEICQVVIELCEFGVIGEICGMIDEVFVVVEVVKLVVVDVLGMVEQIDVVVVKVGEVDFVVILIEVEGILKDVCVMLGFDDVV